MLELYKNIKKRRLELNMTQTDLAKAMGYADKSMIAKIEKGIVDLPLSKIELFADALNTSPSELMGDTWENEILDNARSEIIDLFDGDAYEIAKYQEAEHLDGEADVPHMATKKPASILKSKDTRDIEKILAQTREQLTTQEGLMFDGEPASPEAIDSILSAMQVGMEMAKLKNKEKYTPKKYKKKD